MITPFKLLFLSWMTFTWLAPLSGASTKEAPRTWASKSGSTLQATFVQLERGLVTLRKPDGIFVKIGEAGLSDDDRAYIRERLQKEKQAADEKAAKEAMEKLGLVVGKQILDLPPSLAGSNSLSPQYLLYLPRDYGAPDTKWPFVLFLHGAGERGGEIQKIFKHGPPRLVGKNECSYILVAPQCKADTSWQSRDLIKLVEYAESILNIDPNREYITGLSMGGYGTWQTIVDYPDRFAAAIPIAGGTSPDKARAIKEMPIWSFHGDKDTAVPIANEMEMVEKLQKLGNPHFKFTVYEGCGHDSWTRTYNNQEVWDWLLTQKK